MRGSVRVAWSSPSNTNGRAISGYVVTPYLGVAALPPLVFDSTGAHTIRGLRSGAVYRFAVAAVNANGMGPTSAESNAVKA